MENEKSMSDIIAQYLKQVLEDKDSIQIRRNELAELFDVVPSQINYVINTRFTIQQGYLVESKRGGGGYIKIQEVKLKDDQETLKKLIQVIGDEMTERDSKALIHKLYEKEFVNKNQARLMLSATQKTTLQCAGKSENIVRASILKAFLLNLHYD